MGILRVSALCALVATSVAANNCIARHAADLADLSSCGDVVTIGECLTQLRNDNEDNVTSCFTNAGCSSDEAADEVIVIARRCEKLSRRRIVRRATTDNDERTTATSDDSSEETTAAETTTEEETTAEASTTEEAESSTTEAASTTEETTTEAESTTEETSTSSTSTSTSSSTSTSATITSSTSTASSTVSSTASSTTTDTATITGPSSNGMMGTVCFATKTKWEDMCDVQTTGDQTVTGSCTSGTVLSSECADNMICSTNSSGQDICMRKQGIQASGIAMAVIMSVAAAGLLGGVLFASFKGSRAQKAIAAREAAGDAGASLIPK